MAMQLVPAEKEVIKKVDIIVNDKRVGDVSLSNQSEQYKYHAVLYVKDSKFDVGLAQGHGPTEEQAIANAFESGRRNASVYLELLQRLKEEYLS